MNRPELTLRQVEILELIAAGYSTETAALRLVLSIETIRWHRKAILKRLSVHTMRDAIAIVRAEGYATRCAHCGHTTPGRLP